MSIRQSLISEKDSIISSYIRGMGAAEIGERYDCSDVYIRQFLQECGVSLRGHGKRVYDTPSLNILRSHKELLITQYNDGKTVRELSSQYELSEESVRKYLRSLGVSRRPRGLAKQKRLNTEWLDSPSEHRNYWLGFLFADGNVWKTEVSLHMHDNDRQHLEEFRTLIGALDDDIKSRRGCSSLKVNSINFVRRLEVFGIVPRKSFIARASYELATCRHFWRGVLDGDGHISIRNSKTRYPVIRTLGSHCLMDQMSIFVEDSTGYRRDPLPASNVTRLDYSGRSAQRAAKILYEDCSVALPRKRELAEVAMSYTPRVSVS